MSKIEDALQKAKKLREPLHPKWLEPLKVHALVKIDNPLVVRHRRNAEQLSNLAQQIAFFMQRNNYRVFHIASSREMEGVTYVSVNLAQLMAEKKSAHNILLIDANSQHPLLPSVPGLRDALSGDIPYYECILKVQSSGIHVMPCGRNGTGSSAGINQEKLSDLMMRIRTHFDCIIIDSAPVLVSSEALSLALVSDATFLVVQANKTLWEVVEQSKRSLEKNGCNIGGVILNRVQHVIPDWIYERL